MNGNQVSILAVAVVAALSLILMLTGCANQAAQLQPQIVTADGAVQSGKILLATNGMSAATARQLAKDCRIADAGFKAALVSIDAGQAPADTTVAELLSSLDAIALDLTQTPKGAAVAATLRAKRAALEADRNVGLTGRKKIAVGEVITLIDLIVQLTPEVITEVHALFNNGTAGGVPITAADCHAALDKFEADLTAFETAVTAAGG